MPESVSRGNMRRYISADVLPEASVLNRRLLLLRPYCACGRCSAAGYQRAAEEHAQRFFKRRGHRRHVIPVGLSDMAQWRETDPNLLFANGRRDGFYDFA